MKQFMTLLLLSVTLNTAFAQTGEICNNGVDDDGDGYVDCYDRACAVSTFCKDFFLGEVAQCYAEPPAFPDFSIARDTSTANGTASHLGRVVVGDIDGDGTAEMVTANRYAKKIFVMNGEDGSTQYSISTSYEPAWEDILIGNVDPGIDKYAEIIVVSTDWKVYMYDGGTRAMKWAAPIQLLGDCGMMGLADFNGDGKVELYSRDEVYDALTGTLLVKSKARDQATKQQNYFENYINGGPVAVDILDDPSDPTKNENLEIVAGCRIYTVDVDAGTSSIIKERTEYKIRNSSSSTSINDYNQDGYLDVIASGSNAQYKGLNNELSLPRPNGDNTSVFFWDVKNDVLKTYIDDKGTTNFTIHKCDDANKVAVDSDCSCYNRGWQGGTGRLNIGDLDGDGNLNVSYVSGKFLYALDHEFNRLSWSGKVVNEETSGNTGCTLFDFNGDGQSEIVYRDEKYLYIINGTTGAVYQNAQKSCVSRTNREYPIVVDVDGDGQTEICVTCGYSDVDAFNNFCNISYSKNSHVRIYKSGGDPWVPARKVWNQHGYFNVNVNDDLTIPKRQQKHHLKFSEGGSSCSTGAVRPLNSFLNQSPFLNLDGCPDWKSPDLAVVNNSLVVDPPTCPDKDFKVSFKFENKGDNSLSGVVPVTFYSGDPRLAGAIKLDTINIKLTNFTVGSVRTVSDVTITGTGGPFTLYIAVNDNGSTIPTPISLPNTNFLECHYDNNILSGQVVPDPNDIGAETFDNVKCFGSSTPDNGAAKAWIPESGNVKNTTDYTFYWSIGSTAKPVPADKQGATINGLATNSYTVYGVHKTAKCSSKSTTVAVKQKDITVNVTIKETSPNTNCSNPNGELLALVNATAQDPDGDDPSKYQFEWFEGSDITGPKASLTERASGLKPFPATYTVIVTDIASGCATSETSQVTDKSTNSKPSVTANATPITCSNASSGIVSANVNNTTAGFTFNWYNGNTIKPTADFTGDTYSNLPPGKYTIQVVSNSTQCKSDPKTVEVTQTQPITVSIGSTNDQTSCNSLLPNGSASANVGGQTSGYTFEWFKGQNTKASNKIGSGATITALAIGNYTVKATSADGCVDTEVAKIVNGITTPVLAIAAVTDQTNCSSPDGSITITVSLDQPSDYTFSWYNGTQTKATPDFPDTDNLLEGLAAGNYTVEAVHKTKFCAAQPVVAKVDPDLQVINITQRSQVTLLPTDCNAKNGQMTIDVSRPGNTMGFKVEWFLNNATPAIATETGVITSTQGSLVSGSYSVTATDLNTGCHASDTFPLPFAKAHELKFVSSINPQRCAPQNDGSFIVNLKPTQVAGFSVDDYRVMFYAGLNDSTTPIKDVDGNTGILQNDALNTANYDLSSLSPGFYTVVAVSDNVALGSCKSVPLTVEIKKFSNPPAVKLATTPTANTNCSGTTGNADLSINIYTDVFGSNLADPNDYDIFWTPNTFSGTDLQNISGGIYEVHVVDKTTQCSSDTMRVEVLNTPPVITINEGPGADLIVTDITLCSRPNGATASVVSIDGDATVLGEYDFEWFDANLAAWPNPAPEESIDDLSAGTYYVRATKVAGSDGLTCQSELIEFQIEDLTPGTVLFDLTDFKNPTRCQQPSNDLGSLTVSSQSNYNYAWYAGSNVGPTSLSSTNTLNNVAIPNGDTQATYTVLVTNTDNDCTAQQTYTLQLEEKTIGMTTSARPLTSCLNPDGSVFGTVTGLNSFNYTYNWYNGNQPKASPDYPTGKQVSNLADGEYTLVAVDKSDSYCQSEPLTVIVEDKREFPIVEAFPVAPLTICDPQRPDGVATSIVNGDETSFINYNFAWYDVNPPSGSPVTTGVDAAGLKDIMYTVVASHFMTGCSDTTTVTIEKNQLPIPTPAVQVISDVTACVEVNGENASGKNGVLSASVNGETVNYIFHWYNNQPNTPPDTATFDFKGELYSDLGVGTYYVSATSRETGCISNPADGTIKFIPKIPDFNFYVIAATCHIFEENHTTGSPDGVASITLTNNIDVGSIQWDINDDGVFDVSGSVLGNVEGGLYTAKVTSTMGCFTTKQVEVKTEINPFNGISRNNDQMNEMFYINCIENYPNNHVRIWNRAGTLVYEAEGYNNSEVVFDGQSNKGVSIMGTDLPDGTYYYIVDKRDGSKPLAGYLEIVK